MLSNWAGTSDSHSKPHLSVQRVLYVTKQADAGNADAGLEASKGAKPGLLLD